MGFTPPPTVGRNGFFCVKFFFLLFLSIGKKAFIKLIYQPFETGLEPVLLISTPLVNALVPTKSVITIA